MQTGKRKYPIGIQTFSSIREDNYIYVDKTRYVYELVNEYKYVFLSRPRRFGKSLLTSTFHSFFKGDKELFKGLAAGEMEKEWRRHPVIHLSLATAKGGTVEDLHRVLGLQLGKIEKEYGITKISDDPNSRFQNIVWESAKMLGQKVVVLIDEYDAPLLSILHDEDKLEDMRTALRTFYSLLKDLDPYLRFVFITGISKFSQLSIFSELNNLMNISMQPQYAGICGITQDELELVFDNEITMLAGENSMTRDEALKKLRDTYDGYHFSRNMEGVYNPFSLLSALQVKFFDYYWFSTGTPTFLVNMLRKFHTDVTKIDGSEATAEEFDAPTENMHSILPLFYQSGYITIKGYNPISRRYTLGYPNEEVRIGLMRNLVPAYVSPDTNTAGSAVWQISKALMEDDLDGALRAAKDYFAGIPYQENTLGESVSEGHFTAMLYVMFSFLGMYVDSQVRTAKGRLDIVLKTRDTVYVMELKLDRDAREALAQIDEKGYAIKYIADSRKIVKAGISFSTESRTIDSWIIR